MRLSKKQYNYTEESKRQVKQHRRGYTEYWDFRDYQPVDTSANNGKVHKEQPRQLENKITVEIIRDVRGNGQNYNDAYSKEAI
jgi:hypothetical protein